MLITSMFLVLWFVSSYSYSLPHQESSRFAVASQGQQVQQESKPPTQSPTVINWPTKITVQPIALPPGDNVWAINIVSRGGLTGSGRGDLTVTSEGTLTWSGLDGSCSKKLTSESTEKLARIIFDASFPLNKDNLPLVSCHDCYVTAMVVQRRRAGTDEGIIAVSWDDASQSKTAADVLAIYETAMTYKGCKP